MARNSYKCPVCGKVLTISGPRNIELHEKSKFHIAAMKQDKEIVQEPVQKPNETGIQTTVPEVNNESNKETRGQEGERNDDSGASGDNGDNSKWDGYLC